jgi:hypothetical protein
MFLGSSGSGKTWLLKNKLLLIEDLDGAESSMYPLRELFEQELFVI